MNIKKLNFDKRVISILNSAGIKTVTGLLKLMDANGSVVGIKGISINRDLNIKTVLAHAFRDSFLPKEDAQIVKIKLKDTITALNLLYGGGDERVDEEEYDEDEDEDEDDLDDLDDLDEDEDDKLPKRRIVAKNIIHYEDKTAKEEAIIKNELLKEISDILDTASSMSSKLSTIKSIADNYNELYLNNRMSNYQIAKERERIRRNTRTVPRIAKPTVKKRE